VRPSKGGLKLALAVSVLACGCVDGTRRWRGAVEELPNGGLRVTNPAEGMWRDDSAWRLVRALRLGEVEGPAATVFGAISGLAVDDAGRIYVLDRQANELRIFTGDGAHVRSVGRSGGGPGEYTSANGLAWLSPDTLVVVDQEGGRYTLLTREGGYVRSARRQLGFAARAFSGGVKGGRLYERFTMGVELDHRLALLGTPLRGGDPGLDTVLLPVPPWPTHQSVGVSNQRGVMILVVPFAAGPVYHLDGGGSIWHGHGSEFRVVHSSFVGDTIMEIVLDAVAAPVTDAELADWEGRESTKRFRQMGGQIQVPKMKPFFDGLYLDPEGYLWASVPGGPMETAFAVFDPEGRFVGRLQLNGLKRDTHLEPVVRNGRLHLVGRDELDVQRVYVFRVDR